MQTIASPTAIPAETLKESSFLPTQRQFFSFVLIYFALLLIFRTLISETAGIDEADQLVVGQKLAWGYGPHAPLYTWLMIFFVKVFGPSEFSLTLLRELLLFGIYVLTYFSTRFLTRSHAAGVVAAVALQFHPSIVWESQRELTHSIVASFMILATLFSFLHLRADSWKAYLAFGFFGGLSVLSKYNAALFYAAMLISALSLPALRPLVLNRRMAIAIAITILIIFPNLLWAMDHRDLALSLVWKFGIRQSMPWAEAVSRGLRNWFVALIAHVAPVILVFLAIFGPAILFRSQAVKSRADTLPFQEQLPADQQPFLWHTFLIVCVIVVLSVLSLKVTEFKDRWLQPIFISLPILVVTTFRNALSGRGLKLVLALGMAVTIPMAFMASGRLLFTEKRGRRDVLNAPFRKFAADLKAPAAGADFILAGDYWIAGNLRFWFPDKHVFSPDLAPPDSATGKHCLVVWDATKKSDPPRQLVLFAQDFTQDKTQPTPLYFEQLWKYHHTKSMKVGVWALHQP